MPPSIPNIGAGEMAERPVGNSAMHETGYTSEKCTHFCCSGRVVRQLDEAARDRLLWSAAHYRENAARFRAGLVAVRT